MSERCVCCGVVIPEGRQVCPTCEAEANRWHIPKEFLIKGGEDDGDQRN